MRLVALPCMLLLCVSVLGCNPFRSLGTHRITVQQGNVISAAMLARLRVGMSKNQARFVLGRPLLHHVFNKDRWDYIYRIQIPGGQASHHYLTLYFEDENLLRFESNIELLPTRETAPDAEKTTEKSG